MSSDRGLLIVAIITLVASVAVAGFVYSSINVFKDTWLTGFASSSTGTVNLTVESSASINFTTNNINFGSGRVDQGAQNATLITTGSGSVLNGNWTVVSHGFVLENIGNVNVSLNLTTGKTATTFIGGTSPLYQLNVTANGTAAASATCSNGTGSADPNLGVWRDALGATPLTLCTVFSFIDGADKLRIDLKLAIPSDSLTGALGDVITVAAF